MTTVAHGEPPPSPPLGPLLGTLPPDLFPQEVLRRLGPTDLASLAGAGRGCAAAVAATALMQWAKREKKVAPWHIGFHLPPGRLIHIPPLSLKEACSYAAGGGNREVLEWLHNTGCPWGVTTAATAACAAAEGGHLEVLQWAREHGCLWDSLTTAWAAYGGHLAVLQWLRQHDCPWDWQTCMYAAAAGQLEVLQWVRENDATGEAWSERVVRRYADERRKQEVLTWLDGLTAP